MRYTHFVIMLSVYLPGLSFASTGECVSMSNRLDRCYLYDNTSKMVCESEPQCKWSPKRRLGDGQKYHVRCRDLESGGTIEYFADEIKTSQDEIKIFSEGNNTITVSRNQCSEIKILK